MGLKMYGKELNKYQYSAMKESKMIEQLLVSIDHLKTI